MKKFFKQILLCLRLWLIKRMGYKLPSLREVTPVMPGQLYDHFGYVVQFTCRKKKSDETHTTANHQPCSKQCGSSHCRRYPFALCKHPFAGASTCKSQQQLLQQQQQQC